MALPRLGQYQIALQHPATAFADPELKAAVVELTPMGLPRVISGGFALTYHLKHGRKEWAVRCFHREASELQRRYRAISEMIATAPSGPFVPAEYQANGVLVEGAWYPITKMPWLAAVPINHYIETNLEQRTLAKLVGQFRALVEQLHALGVAHGDLQHGNILVDAFGNLKLVDYDGMFVPALRGLAANESGHVNYQHPQRAIQFDATLDRFSAIVIHVALTALAADPSLWHRHSNGENLLFKRADFDDPEASALFTELRSLPEVRPPADRLQALCRGGYDAVPTLADFLTARFQPVPAPATPSVAPLQTVTVRHQFDVIDASDTERLLRHQGDVVTVVGQVGAARQRWSRQKRPYVVVSLGPDRVNGLTLELWSQALNFFMPAGQVITAYNGRWVRATGLIIVTLRRDQARTPRPGMVINQPSDVQLLPEDEARDLLNTRGAVPWYRANRRPQRAPQRPVSAVRAAAQNRIWGTPSYIPAAPTASANGRARAASTRAPAKKGRPRKPRPAAGTRRRKAAPAPGPAEWWRAFLPRADARGGAAMTATLGMLAHDVVSRLVKLVLAVALMTAAVAVLAMVVLIRLLA